MKSRTIVFVLIALAVGVFAGAGSYYALQRASTEKTVRSLPREDVHNGEVHRDSDEDAHGEEAGAEHSDHANEDASEHADHAHEGESEHAEHADDSAGDHAGHDHEEPGADILHLSPEKLAGLQLDTAKVRAGALSTSIELPGQIEWNTDRLVHVSPRVPGVVLDVAKTLGDSVAVGDLLCVLDSREMGNAKMEYLADLSRFEVAKADFERATTVYENTQKLLTLLDEEPTPEGALEQAHTLEVGANKNSLLTAYTAMHVTRRTFERAQALFDKGVGTEQDLLEAKGAYETARADYVSTREEIAFNLRPDFLRAERDYQVAQTEKRNSERALHILGLTDEQTETLATRPTDVDTTISQTPVYSPIDGLVVDRHLTRGELVDPETKLYTLADLSNVWVMGRVYERDIRGLEEGQKATVRLDAFPGELFEGVVDYVGSQLDPDTRTVQARVVLPNPERRFRPGMFGVVTVFSPPAAAVPTAPISLLVPIGALQRVDDGHVVYRVVEEGTFEPVPVQVQSKTKELAEIRGDLQPDDMVVIGETFVLKSELRREGLSSAGHAGHGH